MAPFIFPQPQRGPGLMEYFMQGWQAGLQKQAAQREQERAAMQMQQAQEALETSRQDRMIRSEQLKIQAKQLDNQQKRDDFDFSAKQYDFKSGKPGATVDTGQYNLDPNMAGKPLAPQAQTDASAALGKPGQFQLPHQPIDFGGSLGQMTPPNQLEAMVQAVAQARMKQEQEIGGEVAKTKALETAKLPGLIDAENRKDAIDDANRKDTQAFTSGQNDKQIAASKKNAEISAAGVDQRAVAGLENQLRDDYERKIKPYSLLEDNINQVRAAAKDSVTGPKSPAKDFALIFKFQTALDDSVVRREEFVAAQKLAGWAEMAKAYAAQVKGNALLSDKQRQDFLKASEEFYAAAQPRFKKIRDQYIGIAQRKGLDPRNLGIEGLEDESAAAGAGGGPPPQTRTTKDGVYQKVNGGWQLIQPARK